MGKAYVNSFILREALQRIYYLALSTDSTKVMGEKKYMHGTHRARSCSTETATQFLSPRIDFMVIDAVSICHRRADPRQ